MISFSGVCLLGIVIGGIIILKKSKEKDKEIKRLKDENTRLKNTNKD